MTYSEDFANQFDNWLKKDSEILVGRAMDDVNTWDKIAQTWHDGATALRKYATTPEEKMVAFQWESYGRLMYAQVHTLSLLQDEEN